MKFFLRLADSKPLGFVLIILLTWILIAGLINGLIVSVSKNPLENPLILQIGNLFATCIVLVFTLRLGWIKKIGITTFGRPSTWLLTLTLAIVIVIVGFYSFFEDITFALNSLYYTQAARSILVRSLVVGFIEEIVFRGVLLYSLNRVWGKTRRGILASIVVQAALFGVLHSLQVIAGVSTNAAISNVLETFIFGILAGVVVVYGESIWPAIFLHFTSNAFILIKGLSSPWITPVYIGYLRQALLESMLVLLSIWFMQKMKPQQQLSSNVNKDTSSST